MKERNYKIVRTYKFGEPHHSILCNGLLIISLCDANLKLARKLKKFLEEDCEDIELWIDQFTK